MSQPAKSVKAAEATQMNALITEQERLLNLLRDSIDGLTKMLEGIMIPAAEKDSNVTPPAPNGSSPIYYSLYRNNEWIEAEDSKINYLIARIEI